MAKFCTDCGKKIEEGKTCTCREETSEKVVKSKKNDDTTEMVTNKVTEASEKVNEVITKVGNNDMVKDLMEVIKGVFVKPMTTVKKYVGSKFKNLSYVLIALAIIMPAIFTTVLVNDFVTSMFEMSEEFEEMENFGVMSLIPMLLMSDDLEDSMLSDIIEINEDAEDIEDAFTVKNGTIIMNISLYVAGFYALLMGSIYVVVNHVMKKKLDIYKILSIVAIVATISSVAYLGATLLVFVNLNLAFALLSLGALYFLITLYQSLVEVEGLDTNKFGVMFVGIYLLLSVAIYVVMKIMA